MKETNFLAFILLCSVSATAWDWQHGGSGAHTFDQLEHQLRELQRQPFFLKVNPRVKVKSGETAFLPCRVKSIGDYLVTWLKGEDVAVLAVGPNIFTSDNRYSVVQVQRPRIEADDWNLLINKTQVSDSGRYYCSINTEPKISHTVYLTVEESLYGTQSDSHLFFNPSTPQSRVSGAPSLYATSGDNVQLECSITGLKSPPLSLYWTKNGTVINARVRTGISLEVEKLPGTSRSTLYLSNAHTKDSGLYACLSDVAAPANISLFIAQGAKNSPVLASLSSASTIPMPTFYEFLGQYSSFIGQLISIYSLIG